MQVKIRTVKKTATAIRKYSRWSTSGAVVDACTGNKGSLPIANFSRRRISVFAGANVAAQHDEDENAADQGERGAGEPHQVHGDGAVLTGGGVVVEAEEQQLVGRIADLI